MTDTEQPQQPEIQEPKHNNLKLIYEHVEYQIALVNRSIDISVTKLGFILGLTTGLILFHPNSITFYQPIIFIFDVLVVILSLIALGFALLGFNQNLAEY
jgi:hypothetical protein